MMYGKCSRYPKAVPVSMPTPAQHSNAKFETTNEVRITDPVTGGQKGRKIERYDLLPYDAIDEVSRVYGDGAVKYDDWNWLKGYRYSLSLGAMLRHISLWSQGQDRDSETGRHHLAHAAWHCLTLMVFQFRGLGTDDRKISIPS